MKGKANIRRVLGTVCLSNHPLEPCWRDLTPLSYRRFSQVMFDRSGTMTGFLVSGDSEGHSMWVTSATEDSCFNIGWAWGGGGGQMHLAFIWTEDQNQATKSRLQHSRTTEVLKLWGTWAKWRARFGEGKKSVKASLINMIYVEEQMHRWACWAVCHYDTAWMVFILNCWFGSKRLEKDSMVLALASSFVCVRILETKYFIDSFLFMMRVWGPALI